MPNVPLAAKPASHQVEHLISLARAYVQDLVDDHRDAGLEPIDVDEPAPASERTTVILSGGEADELTDRALIEELRAELIRAFEDLRDEGYFNAARRCERAINKATRYLEGR